MKIDMHVHTIYSDGEYDPIDVLKFAKENDVSVMSITDHNNINGAKKAILKNPYNDLRVIPGIEFSARSERDALIHILGYNINLENNNLNQVTKALMEDNVRRIKSLVSELKKAYNICFRDEDLEKVFMSIGNIGRPEIAKLCVKYGYAQNVQEAFDKLLQPVDDKLIKREVILYDYDCINYIVNSGGIACLAHPITLKKDIGQIKEYIETLIPYGLSAVEVYHSDHTPKFSEDIKAITEELGLLKSAGSDYHGPMVTPETKIGSGKNNNLKCDDITILNKILR